MARLVHARAPREVHYCPEERDWPLYVKYHDVKYDYADIIAARSARKKLTPDQETYTEQRQCPIYIHKFNKIPYLNASTYNNSNSISEKISVSSEQSPKKMLNRLEETYWSNWKPSRPKKSANKAVKGKFRLVHRKEDREFNSDGDAAQQLIDYFSKPNFTSADSVTAESIDPSLVLKTNQSKQQMKTNNEPLPMILNSKPKKSPSKTESFINTPKKTIPDTGRKSKLSAAKTYSVISVGAGRTSETLTVSRQPSHISIPSDSENGNSTKLKAFKHIDSFVITKKKQSQPKEHFQQPRCIKLFKKHPVRGGSYPLKCFMKKEPVPKGNFRLGAPGSPILVKGSSLNGSRKGR